MTMTVETDATRVPRTASRASTARRRREETNRKHVVMLLGLAELAHLARDRRVQVSVITFALALVAVASLGNENRMFAATRLGAWQKWQDRRLERADKARRALKTGK